MNQGEKKKERRTRNLSHFTYSCDRVFSTEVKYFLLILIGKEVDLFYSTKKRAEWRTCMLIAYLAQRTNAPIS